MLVGLENPMINLLKGNKECGYPYWQRGYKLYDLKKGRNLLVGMLYFKKKFNIFFFDR